MIRSEEKKYTNKNLEYIPITADEPKNTELGSFLDSEEIKEKSILDEENIIVRTAIITSMNDWSCKVLVNDKYEGKLDNKNYFVNILRGEEGSEERFRGGRLSKIFSIGDSIPNLECRRKQGSDILEMYLTDKIDISTIEEYPLENIESIEDGMILECRIREIFPNGCYAKVAPKIDALCPIPENLDLDRDLEPEDLVEVRIKKYGNRVKGKILKLIEHSYFRYDETEGDIIC